MESWVDSSSFDDLVWTLYDRIDGEFFLSDIASREEDHLRGKLRQIGPFDPEICSDILAAWAESGLIELVAYDGVLPTDVRDHRLSSPDTWRQETKGGYVFLRRTPCGDEQNSPQVWLTLARRAASR